MIKLLAEDCIKHGNRFYFSGIDWNIIYSIGLDEKNVVLEDCFPEQVGNADRLCSNISVWKDWIIFVPMNMKNVMMWKPDSKEWSIIEIPTFGINRNRFFQSFIHDNELFIIGCAVPAIICIDLIERKIQVIDEPFNRLKQMNAKSTIYFRNNYVQEDHYIYMVSCIENTIMRFDFINKNVEFIAISVAIKDSIGIAFDGKNYWIASKYPDDLIVWNSENKTTSKIRLPELQNIDYVFGGIYSLGDNELLLSGKKGGSISIHNEDNNVSFDLTEKTYKFIKKVNETIYSMTGDGIFSITSTNGTDKILIEIEEEKLLSFIKNKTKFDWNSIKIENDSLGLKEFILMI